MTTTYESDAEADSEDLAELAAGRWAEVVKKTAKILDNIALPQLPGISQLDQWFYKVQDAMVRGCTFADGAELKWLGE
eukprot:2026321-Lingulodinium_polyedra.AAC.1